MNREYLKAIREHEIRQVLDLIPSGATILEIGAGAGWHARWLSDHGFDVKAIDVEDHLFRDHTEWEVIKYDGETIPFPDASFSVVFTSHVMDYLASDNPVHAEIQRVLKDDGIVVHILPTPSWWAWSLITHYPFYFKTFFFAVFHNFAPRDETAAGFRAGLFNRKVTDQIREFVATVLLPAREGATGSLIGPFRLFADRTRKPFFERLGWLVIRIRPTGVYYSRYKLLDFVVDLRTRVALSTIMGSSSRIYVLKKKLPSRHRETQRVTENRT